MGRNHYLQGNIFKVSLPDFDQIFFFALSSTRMKIRRILAANIHKQQKQKKMFKPLMWHLRWRWSFVKMRGQSIIFGVFDYGELEN